MTIELDEKLVKRCDMIKEEYHQPSIYLCAFELGCETLRGEGIIRVRAHAFLEAPMNKMHTRSLEALIFEGAIPQRRTENVTQALGVQSASQPACGHYY